MNNGLIPVKRREKWRGTERTVTKWVRPKGVLPPSHSNERRRASYQLVRNRALDALGGVCIHCDFDDRRVLQIDHIKGGGGKERKVYSGAAYYYKIIRDPDPEIYQLLCANCHVIKTIDNGEYGTSPTNVI